MELNFLHLMISHNNLGYMNHSAGHIILPHTPQHCTNREVTLTQEVLYIKKGEVRVDFYNDDQTYLESTILKQGDVILALLQVVMALK